MATELILKTPAEMRAATYFEIENSREYRKLTVNGLTGCMGLICVVDNGTHPALLVHDATSGYPHAKKLLTSFVARHAGLTSHMQVIWTAVERCGQAEWMHRNMIGAHITAAGIGTSHHKIIFWPPDCDEDNLAPLLMGHQIERQVEKRKVLQEGHAAWMKDADSEACMICGQKFTLIRRRHHCRNCGHLICGNCSSKRCQEDSAVMEAIGAPKHLYCISCAPPRVGAALPQW